jgi:phosphoserine phosphatase
MSNTLLKKLLILDLDETLIRATETKIDIEAGFFYSGFFVKTKTRLIAQTGLFYKRNSHSMLEK